MKALYMYIYSSFPVLLLHKGKWRHIAVNFTEGRKGERWDREERTERKRGGREREGKV